MVFISIAAGIWGIVIIVNLVRGGNKLYRNAVIMLIIGTVTSGIQTTVSQSVRGSSAPVNIRFYITAFTLLVFLIFRIPPIWDKIQLTKSMKKRATGTTLIVCGIITLTTYVWTAPTHLAAWIDIIRSPLLAGGLAMIISGISSFLVTHFVSVSKEHMDHASPKAIS